jgi:hypothetical protein
VVVAEAPNWDDTFVKGRLSYDDNIATDPTALVVVAPANHGDHGAIRPHGDERSL